MNIDFIKWMCEKAGLELDTDFIDDDVFKICGSTFTINNLSENSLVYALLLQRAIEGVNREDGGFFIAQHCDDLYVYNAETIHDYKYYYFKDMTIDNAKESALMYIYEHEKL